MRCLHIYVCQHKLHLYDTCVPSSCCTTYIHSAVVSSLPPHMKLNYEVNTPCSLFHGRQSQQRLVSYIHQLGESGWKLAPSKCFSFLTLQTLLSSTAQHRHGYTGSILDCSSGVYICISSSKSHTQCLTSGVQMPLLPSLKCSQQL